jgi:hypothetical protein
LWKTVAKGEDQIFFFFRVFWKLILPCTQGLVILEGVWIGESPAVPANSCSLNQGAQLQNCHTGGFARGASEAPAAFSINPSDLQGQNWIL